MKLRLEKRRFSELSGPWLRKNDLKDEDLTGSVSAKITENKCALSGIDHTYYSVCQGLSRKYKVFVFETVDSREP